MQRLKVYLQSRWEKPFRILGFGVGVLLFVNSLHQFDLEENAIVGFALNAALSLSLLVYATFGKKWGKYIWRPDCILLLLAGSLMIWNAYSSLAQLNNSLWFKNLFWMGIVVVFLGVLEPFLNQQLSMTLSPRRIRVQKSVFHKEHIAWTDVVMLEMGDQDLEIQLASGRNLSATPIRTDIQHLRHHLNETWIKAQANQPSN